MQKFGLDMPSSAKTTFYPYTHARARTHARTHTHTHTHTHLPPSHQFMTSNSLPSTELFFSFGVNFCDFISSVEHLLAALQSPHSYLKGQSSHHGESAASILASKYWWQGCTCVVFSCLRGHTGLRGTGAAGDAQEAALREDLWPVTTLGRNICASVRLILLS